MILNISILSNGGRPLFALFLFNNADSSMGRKISQSNTLIEFLQRGLMFLNDIHFKFKIKKPHQGATIYLH